MTTSIVVILCGREEYGSRIPTRGELVGVRSESGEGPVRWHLGCASCSRDAALGDHVVTLHEDFTVSVSPSVVCPFEGCGAHYWIERSKVRAA